MDDFLLSEMYRLELKWEKVIYSKEACELIGAYFSGPAISIAQKINSNEYIKLDFFKQYFPAILDVYVAKFKWGEVIYNNDNTVDLKDTYIIEAGVNKAPKLKNTDYIVIDTEDHEASKHGFNLVYVSYIVNENGILYKFGER